MSPLNSSGDLTLLETKQPFLPSQKWQLFGELMIFRQLVAGSHVFSFNARPKGVTAMVPTWRRPLKGSDGGDFWNFLISKIYVKSQGFR